MFSRVPPQPLAFAEAPARSVRRAVASRRPGPAGRFRARGRRGTRRLRAGPVVCNSQTHAALTLNAECRDGLVRALELSSLPADYTGEQLPQFACARTAWSSLVDLPSRLHETGFLPAGATLSLLCVPLVSGENGRGHGGLRYPAPTGPAGIRPSTGPAGLVRAGPSCICCSASRSPPASRRDRPAHRWSAATKADRQERGDA
ncbi:hypothetical protein ACPA9J_07855 [Pseudomonas aeruginosa]